MNNGPVLFFGIFLTLASSFWGVLLMPQLQIGQQQVVSLDTGAQYPVPRAGIAQQGAEVYRASGCAECHTRQVRPANEGGDIARGWGKRRSVAQDYLYDTPVLLGNLRVGPDLANYGVRQTNVTEVLKLLYKPAAIGQGAMPAYPYLFKRTKLANGQKLSPGAIQIPGEPADIEITPKPEAEELAEYLVSLRADVPLFEAPIPGAQAKAALPADQGTNAPATNAPGTNAAAAPTGK